MVHVPVSTAPSARSRARTRQKSLSADEPPANISSTAARLRQQLVDLIMSGEIVAGKRLDQRQLAKRLKTTTAPLREALSALVTEGLLVRDPGVGVFCRVYTVPEIEEMVEIRGVLEALAARRAAAHITDAQSEELRHLAVKLAAPIPPGGDRDFVATHVKFHRSIVDIARSTRLRALLEHHHLIDGILANIAPALWASEPQDHLELVEAIASRDPDRAESTMRSHIAPTFEKRFADLRKRFGEGPILLFAPYSR